MIDFLVKISVVILILPVSLCGAMLDQRTIDEMVEELAKSEIPTFTQRPKAFRDFLPCTAADFTYCCPICKERTIYRGDVLGMSQILKDMRTRVDNFRRLGLDIRLDERALCQKCCSEILPMSGEVTSLPDSSEECSQFPWRIGDRLEIHSVDDGCVWFEPYDKEFWVWGKYISAEGLITCEDVPKRRVLIAYVRIHPDTESAVVDYLHEGDRVIRCPIRPDDPEGWARIDFCRRGMKATLGGATYDFQISDKYVGNYHFPNDGERLLCPGRIRALAWLYAGKRVVIGDRDLDVAILEAFLKRRKLFSTWKHGPILALKNQIARLRKILQGVASPTKFVCRGKIREHGVLERLKMDCTCDQKAGED